MTVYEGMFILDPTKYSREPDAVTGQLNELVAEFGGTVLVSQLWDERKLAYPIKGQRKGAYWLIYFRMDGDKLVPFERQCELNENVLRRLILKIDPRLAEPLVQHAQEGGTEAKTSATATATAAK
jgi:small subunit ribosomal protein S6